LIFAAAVLVCAVALLEVLVPGHDYPYHAGWFNIAIVAVWVLAAWRARVPLRKSSLGGLARAGIAVVLAGSGIAAVGTVASGLLGPDARTQIGAPGQRIQVPESGDWLSFPLLGSLWQTSVLVQHGRANIPIDHPRQVGALVYRPVSRTVVSISVSDQHGNSLTVTQPEGTSFLSPVLLMTQTQNISGLDLPFDGFSVPAAKRNVKAVLFSAQAAAAMRELPPNSGPAVLFAVDDERGQPLPHGIAIATDGNPVRVAGLVLNPAIFQYDAIQIVSAPPAIPVWIGTVLTLAGIATVTVLRSRSLPTPAPQA
jgi:hypothetical protein